MTGQLSWTRLDVSSRTRLDTGQDYEVLSVQWPRPPVRLSILGADPR